MELIRFHPSSGTLNSRKLSGLKSNDSICFEMIVEKMAGKRDGNIQKERSILRDDQDDHQRANDIIQIYHEYPAIHTFSALRPLMCFQLVVSVRHNPAWAS